MKTTFLAICCILLVHFFAEAQNQSLWLAFEPAELNFGSVNENEERVLTLTVTNRLPIVPHVVSIKQPFRTFGTQPFWVEPADTLFSLYADSSSRTIRVHFKPIHNVFQTSNLIISTHLGPQVYHVRLTGQGTYSKNYYSGTENLSEEPLKTALKTRLNQGYQQLSYNVARDNMYSSIDNKNDSVTCIYTGRKARFNTRAGATSNNFNTEHTYPQGFFSSNPPMVSDLFHLFPTDEAANGSRGNLPFGVATPPYIAPAVNAPSLNGGGRYEPQNSHKGNTARAMLYFVLKYQDYSNFFAPQESILKSWNKQFSVTIADTLRNHAIAQLQNNRNPFIDYPQLADRISRFTGFSQSDSTQIFGTLDYLISLQTDTQCVVVWNEGNKPLPVRNVRIRDTSATSRRLVNANDSAFVLGPNACKSICMTLNANRPLADFLDLELVQSTTSVASIQFVNFVTSLTPGYKFHLKAYPNPTQHKITLSPIPFSSINISVSDIHGKIWFNDHVEPVHADVMVDVEKLPPGIYMIHTYAGSGKLGQVRFVKD